MTSILGAATRDYYHGSYSKKDGDDTPEMISAASLQSFPDSDNDSLSSSTRSLSRAQSPSSPRSIFDSYWSSPTYAKTVQTKDNKEDQIIDRLQKLPMLIANDEDVRVTNDVLDEKSLDDNCVDHQAASPLLPKCSPTKTPFRKILPSPPSPTAVSSSLIQPRRKINFTLNSLGVEGKSLSTSALLKSRKEPHRSCLRKSRYSCSAIVTRRDAVAAGKLHHELRNDGSHDLRIADAAAAVASMDLREELKKSVSFYSQVSVFEFAVPRDQQRGQKGWSKLFA